MSNFWNSAITKDEEDIKTDNHPQRVTIKHKVIPSEEAHELAIDIYETEDKIYIVAPIAGVKGTDIEILIEEDVAFIKGNRKNPFKEYEESLYSSECFWGNFERKFTLPKSVDTREISATFRNGILLIEAPRISPAGVKKIKIN